MKRKMMKMATALALSGCMALTGPVSALAAQQTTAGLTASDSGETEFGITRLAGDTRYDTAIQSADELKTILGVAKFSSVVLASGVNFPDALAGSSLAAQKDAPILLVGSNDANKGQAAGTALTVSYIKKNLTAGGTVYILGGTSAVSAKTEETLTKAGFQVVRLAGDNRYETDLAIINEMDIEEGTDVVVVRGYTSYKTDADKKKKTNPQGYADSLSVSGVAGAEGMPIFLADSKGLTADQLDKISNISPENIYVIGGTSAVSDDIYSSLEDLGCGYVKRLSGDDRYATSTAIAEEFGLYNSDSAVIAYGQNFPDGLTGGVLAAKLGAPLLLTEKGKTTAANAFLKSSLIRSLYVLGGTAVLSDQTISDLTAGISADDICNVTFDSEGGTEVADQPVAKGRSISAPEDPAKDGYLFYGWYTESSYEDMFLFDYETVEEDTTLYAKWVKDDPDAIAVEAASAEVVVGYQDGDCDCNVTDDVTLMTSVEDVPGVTISWTSGNSSVIDSTGKVTRPQEENCDVTLTAAITSGQEKKTLAFNLVVVHAVDTTAVTEDYTEDDIQNMNDEEASIEYSDDETQVTDIEGQFTDIAVDDSADALDAAQSIHTLLGIEDAYEDLDESVVSEDEYGGEYTFQQMYEGYRLYGRVITVSADDEGNTDFMSAYLCSSDNLQNADLTAELTAEEAVSAALEQYDGDFEADTDFTETVVYSLDEYETSPVLAYIAYISGADSDGEAVEEKLIISAQDGTIIDSGSSVMESDTCTVHSGGIDETGKSVSFPAEYSAKDATYYMYDKSGKIRVYQWDSVVTYSTVRTVSEANWDFQAVSAYSNMRKVMSWWKSEFNRNSLDNHGMLVKVFVHDNRQNLFAEYNNAFWKSSKQIICITDIYKGSKNLYKHSFAASSDVLAHESGHAVIQYDAGEDFSGQYENATGAINEGYADVFGCLFDRNWTIAEGVFNSTSVSSDGRKINCLRNIANPSDEHASSKGPDKLSSPYYVDYTVDTSDHGGVHTNSFLISHAAYLMYKAGMSYETLGKLFYKSLTMGYTVDSDFYDVRKNLLKAAWKLKLSSSEVQMIKDAFDAEEIYDQGSSEPTILHSGKDGNLTWSIDSNGLLTVTGTGDYQLKEHCYGDEYNFYAPEWGEYSYEIVKAKISVKGITSMANMFFFCTNLRNIDFSGSDTSKVTDMSNMFSECQCIKNVDLSSLNTSHVINMNSIFQSCYSLLSVNLSGLDTSKVRDMSSMFVCCHSLNNLNLNGIDTSSVTDMNRMFYFCEALENINVSDLDTSQVTNMVDMFMGCESLKTLDLSNFNTSKVTNMWGMFAECYSLSKLDISNFNTSKVTDMSDMFFGCDSLESLNLGKFDTSSVTDMYEMFYNCPLLTTSITFSGNYGEKTYFGGDAYEECFWNAATASDAAIYVSYSGNCTKAMAQAIVDTKSDDSHVYLVD